MKILTNKYIEKHFDINNSVFYNLIIENPSNYYNVIKNLKGQVDSSFDGDWAMYNDDININLSKNSILIKDFFDIDNTDKKLSLLVIKKISREVINQEIYSEFNELITRICIFMKHVCESIDFSIDFDDEIDISSLLKMVNTKVTIVSTSFLEMFVSWVKILIELMNIDLVWTIDIKSYLSREQLILLCKELSLMNITLINIESRSKYNPIDQEDTTIIDFDLCEIHK